ncbi:unnamed protein product [Linum tenue]|uniref:DELLA protein n=1 Tax=Linum tenue TaxID=586396 RepID=A0AAV0MX91_9ROSI|nr:unnamed protein product [Linum tenue]CAI0451482.1 unnamed protein product [Linum tenue]
MKRDHQQATCGFGGGPDESASASMAASCGGGIGKGKLWEEDQDASGMDELLAVLGYKVRSSDMADVAQKLEQLEMAMGTAQDDGISHLACDTIHYNPSDLSGWVDSMLSEFTNPPPPSAADPTGGNGGGGGSSSISSMDFSTPTQSHKSAVFRDDSEYDLRAIPGVAAYPQADESDKDSCRKRMKTSAGGSSNSASSSSSPPPPIAAAAAPSSALIAEPTRPVVLIDSQEAGVRLVHTLLACAEAVQQDNVKLADALVKHTGLLAASQTGAMRKVATYFAEALARRIYKIYPQDCLDPSYSDTLEMHFYETCPYLKFAHFTANQAILEAFATANRVHVIDFGLKQGMQWPALMQALALRPGGPPAFRSVFELHRLLGRSAGMDKVLSTIKAMKPKIVTVVEQEANHNGPVFVDRFTEALHYYSSLFDSLEGSTASQDLVMSELYLGRQICNVVACEGGDRVERHETLTQWRARMESAGFDPVHLGSNAYKQASMLLALFAGGDGYRVEENNGALMLGWHTRPLIATSAWQLAR